MDPAVVANGVGQQDGDENDVTNILESLPDYIVSRLQSLQELDERRERHMANYQRERASLESKYQSLCRPLFVRRAEIVKGLGEDDAAATGRARGIPQFWVCAMENMDVIGSLMTEEDVECLEFLKDVTCEDKEDGKGFVLKFVFDPNNPYFENPVLTKEYDVPNMFAFGDEHILRNVTGCTIRWRPEKCLTHRFLKKKQHFKGKHAGQVRTVTKKVRKDSFFHWFDPPTCLPAMEDMDEEEVDKLDELLDHDFDVALSIRTHIFPKAVAWFTGQAMEQELDEVKSGEEDEEVVYGIRSKLFIFGETMLNVGTGKKTWNERGIGEARILRHREHQRLRLLMRQEKTMKVIANHALDPRIVLEPNVGSDRSWVWSAFDFADGELTETVFALRFADSDIAQEFKTKFTECQKEMEKLLAGEDKPGEDGGKAAEEAAEALSGLSTKDAEDKAE